MKVSIIIPALNEGKALPVLLDSIKAQDFCDCKAIVADAGRSNGETFLGPAGGATTRILP